MSPGVCMESVQAPALRAASALENVKRKYHQFTGGSACDVPFARSAQGSRMDTGPNRRVIVPHRYGRLTAENRLKKVNNMITAKPDSPMLDGSGMGAALNARPIASLSPPVPAMNIGTPPGLNGFARKIGSTPGRMVKDKAKLVAPFEDVPTSTKSVGRDGFSFT